MIYLELMGGLGNQLFQIFALISYSLKYNVEFRIKKTKQDMISPLDNKSPRPPYFSNFLKSLEKYTVDSINATVYSEKDFTFTEIPYMEEDFRISGYFQSHKYFESYYKDICNMIELDRQKEENKYDYFSDNMNVVSLHFRIGDIIVGEHKTHAPVISIDYYVKALNFIKDKVDNIRVLYFKEKTDNVDMNMMILESQFPDMEFVYCEANSDWEELLIMSNCHNNIIANSTFSWFAAYFNNNKDKLVLYPSIWFSKSYAHNSTIDLFPSNWIKIELN